MELGLRKLLPVPFHTAGLHHDRIFEFRGVSLREVPECVADTQQDFGLRIAGHVREQFFVVVEVKAARTAGCDQSVGHIDQRRTFALEIVGQQSVEAPSGRIAVKRPEGREKRLFIVGQRLHEVPRGSRAARVARREDDFGGPVAGINFASLEQLDRQERNLFDPRHFCGYDSDAVEVFAVHGAPVGLKPESFERGPFESGCISRFEGEDIVGCRHRAGERLKAQSKIVKGESNRAGLHAEIVKSHPIFYKDSESRKENGSLLPVFRGVSYLLQR